jgi:hypothetical protein
MSWVYTFYLIYALEPGILTHSRAPIADGSSLWRRFDKWGDGRKRPFGWQCQLPTPYVDFSFMMWCFHPVLTLAFLLFVRELVTLTKTLVVIRSLSLGRWFSVLTVFYNLPFSSLSELHSLQCLSLRGLFQIFGFGSRAVCHEQAE